MRELRKYRGKIINSTAYPEMNGEWFYGWYREDLLGGEIRSFIYDCPTDFEVDIKTVGQECGLKDKHGKEIYESDTVNFWGGAGIIVFNEGCFVIEYTNGDHFNLDGAAVEIIGNIHQHPELLNQDQ